MNLRTYPNGQEELAEEELAEEKFVEEMVRKKMGIDSHKRPAPQEFGSSESAK
jgi:hypothetical protein